VTSDLIQRDRQGGDAVESGDDRGLCGAELVEVCERFYRWILLCALTFVGVATIAALAFLPLRASASSGGPPSSAVVAGVIVLCLTAVAIWHSRQLYRAVRRRPQLELVPVTIAALLMSVVSPMRNELWWSACGILVVVATLVPLRRALLYAVGTLTANLAAHLLAGDLHSTAAVAIVGLWVGLPFWTAMASVIPDRMAAHILRLNANRRATPSPPALVDAWITPEMRTGSSTTTLDQDDDTPDAPAPDAAAPQRDTGPLTARQLQVVALLADGHRHRNIAACLSISEDQVQRHARNAIDRLAVRSANELVAVAVADGLVVPARHR
jgi:DNA-binding CsgD family transcriptional regulator